MLNKANIKGSEYLILRLKKDLDREFSPDDYNDWNQ